MDFGGTQFNPGRPGECCLCQSSDTLGNSLPLALGDPLRPAHSDVTSAGPEVTQPLLPTPRPGLGVDATLSMHY